LALNTSRQPEKLVLFSPSILLPLNSLTVAFCATVGVNEN
jgi:hypothetical protein